MTLPGFTECEPCDGDGLCKAASHKWFGGEPTENPHPCPDCKGTGLQPDPAVVEACGKALHHVLPLPPHGAHLVREARAVARAVLLAYVREVQTKENG